METIDKEVQYGTVSGEAMESLLRLMTSVYVPVFNSNGTWPESVRNEFSGHLQKFMASLTETTNELQGSTILYVPTENIKSVAASAAEKDQVQRLESTVIHWTRQIQEVVNNQESGADSSDDAGPLAEIQFWSSRKEDLSGIKRQLEKPGVLQIVSVLEAVGSTYLIAFTRLADEIKETTQTAEDNCNILRLLQEPCEKLAAAEPKDIPALLPHLLNCIRMIWSTSPFFSIPERLTRLLRKVSNAMIHRCTAKIHLPDIFDGDAQKAIQALQESITSIDEWDLHYKRTVDLVERKGGGKDGKGWKEIDDNNVFAHVFAFSQRCKDLLEVCEGRLQFAPRYATEGGVATAQPVFRGPRGTQVQKELEDIETQFAKQLDSLRNLNYNILDVKAAGWHDDHTTFKTAMRHLEAMTENCIADACSPERLPDVTAGIELLEAFQMLAHRDKIKMKVDNCTADVFNMFLQDMEAVKKELDTKRHDPPLHHGFPKYSGAALWAKSLHDRIKKQMDVLNGAHFLNPGRDGEIAVDRYNQLTGAIEDFRLRRHTEWSRQLGIELAKRLEIKLIKRSSGGETLEVNFDPHLLRFYSEVGYWEKQPGMDIPYSKDVTDLHGNSEKIRCLRENVGLVVRDYNLIITSLTKNEQKLFQERIFHLDRKVQPGLTKFTWAQRIPMIMQYVKDCRKYCREVYQTVKSFKSNNEQINKNCRSMASELLVKIQRKRVYDDGEFEQLQAEHRAHVQSLLERSHREITEVLLKSKEIFKQDSSEVQGEWLAYCSSIDASIEESLRLMVKKSLQEIARAINGDSKADAAPLFKVNVVLDDNRVSLQPSTQALSQMVTKIAQELITVIKVVPRVTATTQQAPAPAPAEGDGEEGATADEPVPGEVPVEDQLPSFFETILNDKDILEKTMVAIMEGMQGNVEKTIKYVSTWDKYKTIWERNKDKVIKQYAGQKHDVSSFETDINHYRKFSEEVKSEETLKSINFVKLDCAPLKQQLAEHCTTWEHRYTALLNELSKAEMEALLDKFETNTATLSEPPRDLDHLATEVNLQQSLTSEMEETEARFGPLEEQYKALAQFEVTVSDEELAQLESLPPAWESFKKMLTTSATKLEKSKTAFRSQLNKNIDDFTEEVVNSRATFKSGGPFSADDLSIEAATEMIEQFRQTCATQRNTEITMKPGMDVFAMAMPEEVDPTIAQTEGDLDLLEAVWGLMREWAKMWDVWKFGTFAGIDIDDMEMQAGAFYKRILKMGKKPTERVATWGVWSTMKDIVDEFKVSLPMIVDLKNPALRQRHWDELIEKVGQPFDPTSDDFTLEKVFDLKLPKYVDDISTLSANANKEMAIETALVDIEAAWKEIEITVAEYKNLGHHRMSAGDELFQQLEDNQVGISTMKATRFAAAFREGLDYWEKALSLVSEVIEQGMNVQRQWMYLENIFIGSEDIKRQLPTEAALFDEIDSNWKFIMDRMVKETNAVKAAHADGLLPMLLDMDDKLTKIQKSLDEYLEKKRMAFPRFYFISSDDLLEILGQARNPEAVQPHFKKMFEGIKKLQFIAPQGARKNYEATAMMAPDGETVPFKDVLTIDGQVEDWLNKVEKGMLASIHNILLQTFLALRQKSTKKDKWVKAWPGGLLITSNQMGWTADCEKALLDMEAGNKSAMRHCRKSQGRALIKFADMLKTGLDKINRNKVMGILIIEVHSRDTIESLMKQGTMSANDFAWLQQLRCYWDKERDDCLFRITSTFAPYGHEYQGNNGRLVITPLTDRAYMTLTTALMLQRGGLPQGPAGTGKTETVKDLSKAIHKYVIVFNCSDGLDFKSMGRMFSGLAQSGSWSCFDEFNRINEEVLSVVAQQIMCILDAIKAAKTTFVFEGTEIPLNMGVGIFVTMNPAGAGYEGRSELPENLKAVIRPISMMAPDLNMIMEVMMFSNGFSSGGSKDLGKKMFTLYSLCTQQLSKQPHYDFGLRNISGVMRAAGSLKLQEQDLTEDVVLFRTLRDMNMPKYIKTDAALFMALMTDIFQGVEPPAIDYGSFGQYIEEDLKEHGYQVTAHAMKKTIELYEAKNTRHCVMLVGNTGSGKSVAMNTLARVKTKMAKKNISGGNYNKVTKFVLNPKAFSDPELYGFADVETREWTDGVLAVVMRNICSDEKTDEKWLVLDGPVDTLWIESMNTVMDDNKMLTLMSGERIALPPMVTLCFEVQDLLVASPATVSRAGMIYFDVLDMGWQPNFDTWIQKKRESGDSGKILADTYIRLFEKYVTPLLLFKQLNCKDTVFVADQQQVICLMSLVDTVTIKENGVDEEDEENYARMVETWFVYSVVWSIGATVDEDSRKKMDQAVREIDASFPTKGVVYDYYVDPEKKAWRMWESLLNANWRPPPNTQFFNIQVPTVDSLRNEYIVGVLARNRTHTLLVGGVGNGKTTVAAAVLNTFDVQETAKLIMNFSAQTSSPGVQNIIEGVLEKRTKDTYGPPAGRNMIALVDDMNMPQKDKFGSHAPLELLRMWIQHGMWYDRSKHMVKKVKDMQLLCCMGPAGGGRTQISMRYQAQFHIINVTTASTSDLTKIFGTLLNIKLSQFEAPEINSMADVLCTMLINIFHSIKAEKLPTPTKPVYLFNMRDMSKVVQGIMNAHKDYYDTSDSILRLFIHECTCVFSDRLNSLEDREWFRENMDKETQANADGAKWSQLYKNNGIMTNFGSFMATSDDSPYEELADVAAVKLKLEETLDEYNLEGGVPMDLVLFKDAVDHVCKIHRVLQQQRGNMLLVGVGGSGRQSLTRLASFLAELKVFTIEINKYYDLNAFHEDLKLLYNMTGVENKPTVFLFNDTQVVEESFLEDLNNVLSSGEVPNLFPEDELAPIRDAVRKDAKAAGVDVDNPAKLYGFFIERARANLHVVLAMSPIGEDFRRRVNMFPGLVNCTTIDWYLDWPPEALKEVAQKILDDVALPGDAEEAAKVKISLADVFQTVHTSVIEKSAQMLSELKRHNYVTPTNYLELVNGYKKVLAEKRQEVGDNADKLRNGLIKIAEGAIQVDEMSVQLAEKKIVVEASQKECEELLVVIVQDKRVADEQEKSVLAEKDKIDAEAVIVRAEAAAAMEDLNAALPALAAAQEALSALNKNDMSEIKAYSKPPPAVELVLCGVMVLRRSEPTWVEAKKQLGDASFLASLVNFNKDSLTDQLLGKIGKYTKKAEFEPDAVGKVSKAAKSLSMWCIAMEVYGKIAKTVEPKRLKVKKAQQSLEKKQKALNKAEKSLQEVQEKVAKLKQTYDTSIGEKKALEDESELLELKLSTAEKLINGLSGERVRWEQTIVTLDAQLIALAGDCLAAAAFLSYAGPFQTDYRDALVQDTWLVSLKKNNVPCSSDFSIPSFLSKPTDVGIWNVQGLPTDDFSTENGILTVRGERWPLMIDPQRQANKWVKKMEGDNDLKIIDLKQSDFLRTVENAITFGNPVLLQDIETEIDPALEPVLGKQVVNVKNRLMIKLGDKELDYNPEFKLYITTRLGNPHYTPEISTKTTLTNFSVKQSGLEDQLLGLLVAKERPDLQKQKVELVMNLAAGRKQLVDLEDEILRLLREVKGSLLDDADLLLALERSKVTSEEVTAQIEEAVEVEVTIDVAREVYRPGANISAVLYFVLSDLTQVDPMYQFSLDAYFDLYSMSIDEAPRNSIVPERVKSLNEYHTYAVYRNTCRALFEKHKLLFAFLLTCRLKLNEESIDVVELDFFLRGGTVLDKSSQAPNPCSDWIDEASWDHATEVSKMLPAMSGFDGSFEQYGRDWKTWYGTAAPESEEFPGEWENKCGEFQRLIVLRCLRPDRVTAAATTWIINNMNHQKYVEPPPFDLDAIFKESVPQNPLIFVLSAGVDPTKMLRECAANNGMGERFGSIALGQGQAPYATRMIDEGVRDGNWVFLANCHLMTSWLGPLEKIVDELGSRNPHADFRLWLSSSPNPKFPIAILQQGLKMTTEPPKGIKANLLRLYNNVSEEMFHACKTRPQAYKRLLFGLVYFHAALLERVKFLGLGWAVVYDFNDSDFEICESLLTSLLDEYEDIPYDALRYLTAEANYGGRVTDDWDRRLLVTYMHQFYHPEAVETDNYKMSGLPEFYVPDDGSMKSYKEFIRNLPVQDLPEAFGQHPNAEIASQITDTADMLSTLLSLSSGGGGGGADSEGMVDRIAADMLGQLPDNCDVYTITLAKEDDPSALNTVLLQEIDRYNGLLDKVRNSLTGLRMGIKGLVVMSAELDVVFKCLLGGAVPPVWLKTYPSMKPLGPWMRDLIERIGQLNEWGNGQYPKVYWMGGFTYPTGFLTAVLQTAARKTQIGIDQLTWEFTPLQWMEKDVPGQPKDGVYVKGLYLEGAGWDNDNYCLREPKPMELIVNMPIMWFKPTEVTKKQPKGMYQCPCYLYPIRTGSRERPSYTITVLLKTGALEPEHWVKRGTALLLSLSVGEDLSKF